MFLYEAAHSMTQGSLEVKRPSPRLTPEKRRHQILEESTKLISQSGFNAVSIASIAEACGVRKGLIHHYFPSMHKLLAAVLEFQEDRDFLVLAQKNLPAPERHSVRAWLTRYIEHNLNRREMIRLHRVLDVEALAPDHPAHALFASRSERLRDAMRQVLAWKPDPVASSEELIIFWHGLELEWLRNPNLDVMAQWERFCGHFFADEA